MALFKTLALVYTSLGINSIEFNMTAFLIGLEVHRFFLAASAAEHPLFGLSASKRYNPD